MRTLRAGPWGREVPDGHERKQVTRSDRGGEDQQDRPQVALACEGVGRVPENGDHESERHERRDSPAAVPAEGCVQLHGTYAMAEAKPI
ncbi:MAG: hypothetical protein JWN24_4432 [Phycisphaerales bacterium]|nr:hypothetical protein [Phycisphaerales bacterium]